MGKRKTGLMYLSTVPMSRNITLKFMCFIVVMVFIYLKDFYRQGIMQ